MKKITFKHGVLPLAVALTLTGCQDPEIQGIWTGPKESFNKETIASLFTASINDFDGEKTVVSALRNEAGGQVFNVSFKGGEYTEASLHTLLDNIKKYQSSFTTQLTVKFINPEPNNTSDKKDSFPQMLANAGIRKEGRETTDMVWAKAEINVFTLEASKNAPRLPQRFGMARKIYCSVSVPLKNKLPDMTINALPPFTTADVPDDMRNKMSPAAMAAYVKKQNAVRENVVASTQSLGLTYPHEITFSDAGLNQFREINHHYPVPKTYRLRNKALTLNYGEIPSSDANTQTLLGNDYGGAIHHRCERIVREQTPDIFEKIAEARRYKYVDSPTINPDWQPKK